ncbi:MAG: VC0807 family protein [Actinomycetes bacterium]
MSSPARATNPHIIHLPPWRDLARRTAENVLEATLVPMALFYLFLGTVGVRWGMIAGLCWFYAAIIRRVMSGQRMSGLLVMAAVLLTARTAIAFATGSAFIYFLQPTLGTFLVSALFLISVPMGKPLAERLAHDFCALPDSLMANARVKRFFYRISLLWAFTYLVNGSTMMYLLTQKSLSTYLMVRSFVSMSLTLSAITISCVYFFRSMRHEGLILRWHKEPTGEPAAVPVPAAA